MAGRLVAIYTTGAGGEPMVSSDACRAVAGAGLEGDRYATKSGNFSATEGAGREVTLIAREAIAAANEQGVRIDEHETRRNLVTEGVDLAALIGKTFSVGDAVLIGVRDCPPCALSREADAARVCGPRSRVAAACGPMSCRTARSSRGRDRPTVRARGPARASMARWTTV